MKINLLTFSFMDAFFAMIKKVLLSFFLNRKVSEIEATLV